MVTAVLLWLPECCYGNCCVVMVTGVLLCQQIVLSSGGLNLFEIFLQYKPRWTANLDLPYFFLSPKILDLTRTETPKTRFTVLVFLPKLYGKSSCYSISKWTINPSNLEYTNNEHSNNDDIEHGLHVEEQRSLAANSEHVLRVQVTWHLWGSAAGTWNFARIWEICFSCVPLTRDRD